MKNLQKLEYCGSYNWRDELTDIKKIELVLEKFGFEASPKDIALAWIDYSNSIAAGWMVLDGFSDAQINLIVTSRMAFKI